MQRWLSPWIPWCGSNGFGQNFKCCGSTLCWTAVQSGVYPAHNSKDDSWTFINFSIILSCLFTFLYLNLPGKISPPHWYFTSALPRAMLAAMPLSLVRPSFAVSFEEKWKCFMRMLCIILFLLITKLSFSSALDLLQYLALRVFRNASGFSSYNLLSSSWKLNFIPSCRQGCSWRRE